jgi:hypothetical protein
MSPSTRRRTSAATLCLGLALICLGLLLRTPPSATAQTSEQVTRQSVQPDAVVTVDFSKMAAASKRAEAKSKAASESDETGEAAPVPMTIEDSPAGGDMGAGGKSASEASQATASPNVGMAGIASPAPSTTYLAQEDAARVGTSTFTIPPDTMGAVGRDKVFVQVNNNYRVQNKATGAALSTVSITTFWSSLAGVSGVFDPRVQYDPYNDRWLVAAVSNAQTANSSVLMGVSNSSDPLGSWTLYRFIVGSAAAGGRWADFPMLGFNKNYVAVAWNEFTNAGAFVRGRFIELDYPQMRAGAASPAGVIFNIGGAFCMNPAETYSPTEGSLYFVVHLSSGGATYVVITLSGPAATPALVIGATKTRPGGGWIQPGGDIVPQKCDPLAGGTGCPATLRGLDVGDSFIRSNVVFRNGLLYYAQTVGLRQGTTGPVTHTAAQWTAIDTAGNFVDGGRVEDPTATSTNGGKWYVYPSISVNKNNDILLGFSVSSSADYVSAAYSFRDHADAPGTMRDPFVYKAGEDYYEKTFTGTRNRWGDYSHTMVDPVNDRHLWTIQEYAGTRISPGVASNNSRWGTWWAKVLVNQAPIANAGADQTLECSGGQASTTLDGTASSDPDGDALTFAWSEGATPLGTGATLNVTLSAGPHTITLNVTDPDGFTATDTVNVNVVDTIPPTLALLGANPFTVECHTAFVDPGATASDGCAGDLTPLITRTGLLNVNLPGTYTLTYSVSDGSNTASATRTVVVVDTTAPVISGVSASPNSLWPPNHKMVDVTINYAAFDTCCLLTMQLSATSNEPDNGLGDGDTADDIEIVDAHHVRLRAERSGKGDGRTYTVNIKATDCSGNFSTRTVTVAVPKSQK